jgi:hypothetical protein
MRNKYTKHNQVAKTLNDNLINVPNKLKKRSVYTFTFVVVLVAVTAVLIASNNSKVIISSDFSFNSTNYQQNAVKGVQTSIEGIEVLANGLSGGGFQSDVTISSDGQTVFSGGDVSGIHKSND